MRVALRVIAVSLLLLTTAKASVPVVCVCVRSPLKEAAVRGRVVATYKQRAEEPIPNATVKLMKCVEGDCQTITEVTADESGHFSVEGVKPGEYDIVASATHFERVWVKLKVRGRSRDRNKEIVFGLEPGLDCCTGWAKVRKVK
ncbi:MAG: carboxypeptidase-like regulatory domain-containing protein [Acidobacteria bacterium]|nr:carboxypeptidase-like regulatory domain-containing protein [Acidobacteriota bacterium]